MLYIADQLNIGQHFSGRCLVSSSTLLDGMSPDSFYNNKSKTRKPKREQLIDGKAVIYPNVKKAVIHYYLYGCKLVPLERLQEWNSNSAHYRWLYYGETLSLVIDSSIYQRNYYRIFIVLHLYQFSCY
ncbi:hypothetical protein DINM_002684 [Dirofilaria immitis]|nr:hypothetical protein [Dirofilaria immitis]